MLLNLDTKLRVHNRYDFVLCDSRTGKIKQKAYAENVVLNNMWTLLGATSTSMYTLNMFYGIAMGEGSGTPAATDTALFTPKFIYDTTFTSVSRSEAYPTCAYTYKISIPATSSYVGNLTEVGLRGRSSFNNQTLMWTHAILKDSEGNPITIAKTDLDILVVTVTIYVTFSSTDNNFHWYAPGPGNAVCEAFRTTSGHTPFNSVSLAYCGTLLQRDDGCITSAANVVNVGGGSYSVANKTITVTTKRMETGVGNTRYYNGIILGYDPATASNRRLLGGIIFPHATIFPQYTIENMRVGTGDGTTKDFNIPIEYFVANTDVVKVNGTTLTRGTDYTIDNVNELNTADDSMNISNFLEVVSDTPAAAHEVHSVAYPFSHQIEGDSAPYLSSEPTIYKVIAECPCKKVNTLHVNTLKMCQRGVSSYIYSSYVYNPIFYDNQVGITIPTSILSTLDEILADIAANPSNYAQVNTPGTLIIKAHVDGYLDVGASDVRVIQGVNYTVYYFFWDAGNGRRLYWASTGGNAYSGTVNPLYNSTSSTSDWILSATERIIYPYRGTRSVGGATWHYGSAPCTTAQVLTGARHCRTIWQPNINRLAGCILKVCGGNSAQGPWTDIASIALDTLTEFSYLSDYGIADEIRTCAEATYDYYKIWIDTTNATSPDLINTTRMDITPNANILAIGYVGGKIRFTTAPAADAVITLTANIDRPFKNANFVIDTSMILQLGGA